MQDSFDERMLRRLLTMKGDVRVRHDVDVSTDAARWMARFEHELGVSASYHLMPDGPFYAPTPELAAELRALGHRVCLHADIRGLRHSKISDRVGHDRILDQLRMLEREIGPLDDPLSISVHMPPHDAMWRRFSFSRGTVASGPEWRGRYCSDSEGRFRFKHPLRRTSRPLQLNLHPEWWMPNGRDVLANAESDDPEGWDFLFDR